MRLFCQKFLQNISTLSFPITKETWQGTCFLLFQCFVIQTQCAWHPKIKYISRTFCTFCSQLLAFLGLLKRTFRNKQKSFFSPFEFLKSVKELLFISLGDTWSDKIQIKFRLKARLDLDDIFKEMNFEFGKFSLFLFMCASASQCMSVIHEIKVFQ